MADKKRVEEEDNRDIFGKATDGLGPNMGGIFGALTALAASKAFRRKDLARINAAKVAASKSRSASGLAKASDEMKRAKGAMAVRELGDMMLIGAPLGTIAETAADNNLGKKRRK